MSEADFSVSAGLPGVPRMEDDRSPLVGRWGKVGIYFAKIWGGSVSSEIFAGRRYGGIEGLEVVSLVADEYQLRIDRCNVGNISTELNNWGKELNI